MCPCTAYWTVTEQSVLRQHNLLELGSGRNGTEPLELYGATRALGYAHVCTHVSTHDISFFLYTCLCTCTPALMCVLMPWSMLACMCAYIRLHIDASMCIHMAVYVHVCTHVCVCVHLYTCVHTCVCLHVYLHARVCACLRLVMAY